LFLAVSSASASDATRNVLLRWEAPENAADAGPLHYVLFRSPNGGPEERVDVGEGTEIVLGFLADRSYQLELIAVGAAGESGRSNRIELAKAPEVPAPPRRFEIVVPASGEPSIREIP
jgi:hypothetical protein